MQATLSTTAQGSSGVMLVASVCCNEQTSMSNEPTDMDILVHIAMSISVAGCSRLILPHSSAELQNMSTTGTAENDSPST